MIALLGGSLRLLWVIAAAGAGIGALFVLYGLLAYTESVFAPVRAAWAVTGIALAVVPYLFASAVANLAGKR